MFKDVVKHLNISAAEKEKVNIALSMSYAAGSQSLSLSNLLYCTDHNNEIFLIMLYQPKNWLVGRLLQKWFLLMLRVSHFFVVKVL